MKMSPHQWDPVISAGNVLVPNSLVRKMIFENNNFLVLIKDNIHKLHCLHVSQYICEHFKENGPYNKVTICRNWFACKCLIINSEI